MFTRRSPIRLESLFFCKLVLPSLKGITNNQRDIANEYDTANEYYIANIASMYPSLNT